MDGRPVAVKRAAGSAASGRLAREAAALEAARHPGVVELLSVTLEGDEPSITTAWVSGGSVEAALGRATPMSSLIALVADAAMTISELHERGVVHGRIDVTHVLIGDRGAIITGLAEASTDGEPPTTCWPSADCSNASRPVERPPPCRAGALTGAITTTTA